MDLIGYIAAIGAIVLLCPKALGSYRLSRDIAKLEADFDPFPQPLKLKEDKDGFPAKNDGKYELLSDFLFHYQRDGVEIKVTVPAGFQTDFASIPMRSLLKWWLDNEGDAIRYPSVIHDKLYHDGTPRSLGDAMIAFAMRFTGARLDQRVLVYLALRVGGWLSYWRTMRRKTTGEHT